METLKELYEQKKLINAKIRAIEIEQDQEQREKNMEDHKKFIGKCYKKRLLIEGYNGIQAFKILCLSQYHADKSVDCLCVIDDYGSLEIKRKSVWLWSPITDRMITFKSDPAIIDSYEEITEEEFETILKEHLAAMGRS